MSERETADPQQDVKEEALGNWATEESEHQVPRDGGDNADATRDGGPDPKSPSRVGAGSVPQPGTVGQNES